MELRARTVVSIADRDASEEDDAATVAKMDQWSPTETRQRKLVPKGNRPVNGHLTIMRYPASGDVVQFCIYTWEPAKEESQLAFELAMENQVSTEKKLAIMAEALTRITSRTYV